MANFSLTPTYYQITWTDNSPTDYSGLNGTGSQQDGGLDATTAFNYYRMITITGINAITSTVMSAGWTIIINGYTITFAAADTLTDIIRKINLRSRLTKVIADQRVALTYLSLSNVSGSAGSPFYVAEGNATALSALGITPNEYQYYPQMVGTAFTSTGANANVSINGATVTFTAGNLANAVAELNAQTVNTGVIAYPAATRLQLASVQGGGPFAINSINAAIGWSVGNYVGNPTTLAQSQAKELANMRWLQVINQLETSSTPSYIDNLTVSGNYLGNAVPTTFSFTVGYDHPDQITTTALSTEPDAGSVFIGEYAVQRFVARALTTTTNSNRKVYDPSLKSVGNYAAFDNTPIIVNLTAAAIDIVANIITVSNNITVVPIPGL